MPLPKLDCGCPARPAYAYRKRGRTLLLCQHHGRADKDAAIRQGFIVAEIDRIAR